MDKRRVTFIWREERGQLEGRNMQGPGTPAWLGGRLEVGEGAAGVAGGKLVVKALVPQRS